MLERRDRSHRQLRRREHERVIAQEREDVLGRVEHRGDIGVVVVVDRSVEGDPDDVGIDERVGWIGREPQRRLLEPHADEFGESGFGDRRLPQRKIRDGGRVAVESDDIVPHRRKRCGRHRSQMPEPVDANLHERTLPNLIEHAELLC